MDNSAPTSNSCINFLVLVRSYVFFAPFIRIDCIESTIDKKCRWKSAMEKLYYFYWHSRRGGPNVARVLNENSNQQRSGEREKSGE